MMVQSYHVELIRWRNTLKRWRGPILNHSDNDTTIAFTQWSSTKTETLKRAYYGLRNVNVCWRKMCLRVAPSRGYFHNI